MLKQVADGVWVHESKFLETETVVVQGERGVLLIDPGITSTEFADLAKDLRELGQSVVAGFSTHPHWDHLLWHSEFGEAPRYGTERGEAEIKAFLAQPDWRDKVAPMLPADIADQIPMDSLFGKITGLPAGTARIPWDGPRVRIIENQGHATGSAILLVEEPGVLAAGDLVSDILIPFLELDSADPVNDYLAALEMIEDVVGDVRVVIPGHGSVGNAGQLRQRIKQDRAYVEALRESSQPVDPRLTTGPYKELLKHVHEWQFKQITGKSA